MNHPINPYLPPNDQEPTEQETEQPSKAGEHPSNRLVDYFILAILTIPSALIFVGGIVNLLMDWFR